MRIDFTQVTKRFGQTTALDEVDLRVEPGERVALIGPNGSGKTTLTRIILGMLRPEGEVTVGGCSPFEEREQLADRVAYVPQIAPQTSVPVAAIIETVCHLRAMPASRVVGVAERLQWRPAEHADKPFKNLSGGMKQKLLIALALAAQPRLLIMDEPTASLDADARRSFFEMCAELDAQTTVLLCSHRLEEVRHLIERIVALDSGRVSRDGPVEDFVAGLGRAAVELKVPTPSDDMLDWLAARGFRQVFAGRWVNFMPWNQKLTTVEELIEQWADEVDDMVVNDLHELQVQAPSPDTRAQGARP